MTRRAGSSGCRAPGSAPSSTRPACSLHTNLGRAPLAADALADAAAVGGSATRTSSIGLATGRRGSRHEHAGALLARACGAEAGLVVNNNAAAVLLALAALAAAARSSCRAASWSRSAAASASRRSWPSRAAGSSRSARPTARACADYERALGAETRAGAQGARVELPDDRVHRDHAGRRALAGLGPPVMVDAGSGLLDETTPWLPHRPAWLRDEPGVRQAHRRRRRARHVLGRQAARRPAGRRRRRTRATSSPRSRATRSRGRCAPTSSRSPRSRPSRSPTSPATRPSIPLWRMATRRVDDAATARRGRRRRGAPAAKVVDTEAVAGGGSLPGLDDPVGRRRRSTTGDADGTAARGCGEHGVVARVADGARRLRPPHRRSRRRRHRWLTALPSRASAPTRDE